MRSGHDPLHSGGLETTWASAAQIGLFHSPSSSVAAARRCAAQLLHFLTRDSNDSSLAGIPESTH